MDRALHALRQIGYLIVPTTVGYLALGLPLVAAVYERGGFGRPDAWLVYLVLAGYALGLPAAASSRLLQNVYFAAGETRRPARLAVLRVLLAAAMGIPLMFWLDRYPVAGLVGLPQPLKPLFLGALGLALASGIAAWVELALLRRGLRKRLPELQVPFRRFGLFAAWTLPALAVAGGLWWLLRDIPSLSLGVAVVAAYAATYLLTTRLTGVLEARTWHSAFRPRRPTD